jgi:hypothetical protein
MRADLSMHATYAGRERVLGVCHGAVVRMRGKEWVADVKGPPAQISCHGCGGAAGHHHRLPSRSPSTSRLGSGDGTIITMTRTATLVLWLLCVLPLATAHIIHVGASSKECFFEDLNVNDKARAGSLGWAYTSVLRLGCR